MTACYRALCCWDKPWNNKELSLDAAFWGCISAAGANQSLVVWGGMESGLESPAEGSQGYIKICLRRLQDVFAFISHLENNESCNLILSCCLCLLGEDQCIPVRAAGMLSPQRHDQALTKQRQIAARGAQRL